MWSMAFGSGKRPCVLCVLLTFSFVVTALAQTPSQEPADLTSPAFCMIKSTEPLIRDLLRTGEAGITVPATPSLY
jgi:hypothetical protein